MPKALGEWCRRVGFVLTLALMGTLHAAGMPTSAAEAQQRTESYSSQYRSLSSGCISSNPASAIFRRKTSRCSTPTRSALTVPAGWPHAGNTGVPAGTVLRPSGSITVTEPGTVLDSLLIDGCVDVKAAHVTIRRSKIQCGRPTTAIRNISSGPLLIEDVEIDGRGAVRAAVGFGNYTLRRVNIHNVLDGPRLGSNTTVVDSYIHDLARTPESHNDTLQTTGGSNIVIRHNTLLPYKSATRDPMNAAFMLGTTSSPRLQDILVEDNYVNGGNYTFNIREDVQGVSNLVFRGNRFGRDHRYGPAARVTGPGRTFDSSNVWHDNGQPVRD